MAAQLAPSNARPRWPSVAFGLLLLLSAWTIFVLLPTVWVQLNGGDSASTLLVVTRDRDASALQSSVTASVLFTHAALAGWRDVKRRRGDDDALWAGRILQQLWCTSSSSGVEHSFTWEAAIGELTPALWNRSQLDRGLAVIGCRHACDDARLNGATSAGNQPVCGDGLCQCDGGLSYGLDLQAKRDEPSPAFYAAHVIWSVGRPATTDRTSADTGGGGRSASSLPPPPPREAAVRELRRHESVYAKARQELARDAAHHSLAFSAVGAERGASRFSCAHLTFAVRCSRSDLVRMTSRPTCPPAHLPTCPPRVPPAHLSSHLPTCDPAAANRQGVRLVLRKPSGWCSSHPRGRQAMRSSSLRRAPL